MLHKSSVKCRNTSSAKKNTLPPSVFPINRVCCPCTAAFRKPAPLALPMLSSKCTPKTSWTTSQWWTSALSWISLRPQLRHRLTRVVTQIAPWCSLTPSLTNLSQRWLLSSPTLLILTSWPSTWRNAPSSDKANSESTLTPNLLRWLRASSKILPSLTRSHPSPLLTLSRLLLTSRALSQRCVRSHLTCSTVTTFTTPKLCWTFSTSQSKSSTKMSAKPSTRELSLN